MKKIIMTLIVCFMAADLSFAGGICPEKVQAALLLKVVAYTKNLVDTGRPEVIIGVLNGGSMLEMLREGAKVSKVKIEVKEVTLDNMDSLDVIYIPEGTPADGIDKVKTKANVAKIMTVGGNPSYVTDNKVTLSFQIVNKRPKILINISSSSEEGVRFSAQLLKIADTI